jgi:uncharacterized protein (DUF433 family)
MAIGWRDRITVEPGKRGGQPLIRGMRLSVRDVLEYLGSGMTIEEIQADFPELTREDVYAAMAYAAEHLAPAAS